MATQVKDADQHTYDQDFYVWALRQAELLRARRFEALDLEHLIEEVQDLAMAVRSSVRSRSITIMIHLLKLEHSPAVDPRLGWRATVRTQRTKLDLELTPTLRRQLADDIEALYTRARKDTVDSLRDHGEDQPAEALPATCPYTVEQITGDWLPD